MAQTKVKDGLLNFPDRDDFIQLPSGTTAQRPSSPEQGYSRYNTTDKKLEFWNGTVWQQLPGVVAPIITSLSYPGDDLAADPAGGQTITINGSDFKTGATVTVGSTTPSVITFVSATQITFEAPAKAAGDYDVVVTNVDGGNATSVDGMSYNGVPSWTTAAGNLGTFPAGSTIPTITLVATEPDSGTISYSVTTGSLPTGLTLTGADIDGSVPTPAGETTYNFSVTASDDENQSTERAFNIVVYLQVTNIVNNHDPFGDSSGLALYKLNGDANDVSGNYSFSTASNVSYPSGVFNQSLDLLSSTSYASGTGLTSTFPLTFSFWVKPDASNLPVGLLINKRTTATNGYSITGTGTDNSMGFLNNGGYAGGNGIANNLETGTWNHIVVIMNTSGWESYVNGSYYNKYSGTLNNTSNEITLGKSSSIGNWVGSTWGLDQFRVLNRELTPLEVQSLYQERVVLCGGQAETVDILGDNSCIALYPLDGNANDLSGNYSGTPTNVSYGVGEFDLAGVFNGTSSYVGMATNSLNSFTSYTASFWIYDTGTAAGGRTIISNYGYTAASNVEKGWIIMRNGTKLRVINSTTGLSSSYYSTNNIPFNQWVNIVVSNTQSEIKIYFNGALDSTHTTIGFLNDASWPMRPAIGVYRYDTTEQRNGYFSGSIDQVRIFNKALSSSEVTTLYNETACTKAACTGTTNTLDILGDGSCIATYTLDGTPADLSGNYNGVQTDVTYPQGYFDLGGAFNGSTSEITNSGTVNVDLDFSVSLWFNNQGAGTHNAQILWNGKDRDNSLQLNYSTNTVVFFLYDGTLRDVVTPTISSGWNNVVATRSKTSGLKIYLNGSLQDTNSFTGNASTLTATETIGNLGRAGINRFFNGSIDQVRIFNKALSAGEVTTLYNETACN